MSFLYSAVSSRNHSFSNPCFLRSNPGRRSTDSLSRNQAIFITILFIMDVVLFFLDTSCNVSFGILSYSITRSFMLRLSSWKVNYARSPKHLSHLLSIDYVQKFLPHQIDAPDCHRSLHIPVFVATDPGPASRD